MATNIVRDSDVNELNGPPKFKFGEKVRSKKMIRNDGTFVGREIGEVLVKKGEVGYIKSINTFLQQFYIYAVDFPERGYAVGMKGREIESLDNPPPPKSTKIPDEEGEAE
ncbi:nitrogen fixation protein NifZ [Methylocaldum szegediense]|jgi:nitrogen fixation protein NifZ|uniref:NifZ protein n=1 Tax=Methylocaldum szegediense TaxID=73780 RepID=A0ABM9I8S9_9GAMM|nr:nitrogen fixation protein NifZ [Methylocaldum szegediense]CAI8962540.1 putative NifZ protein [Methylocaldum szegediense]